MIGSHLPIWFLTELRNMRRNETMYLSSNAVVQCSHGGRLYPNGRHFIRLGKQKLLTRDAVLKGKIVDCPNNCHKVTELISGCESEAHNVPLLKNLEFLTDGTPPGRAVVLGEPEVKESSSISVILWTSVIWLCLGSAAVLGTIYYYQRQFDAYQQNIRALCQEQMNTLADDLTRR